jgi:hypothetical protein
VSSLEDNIIKFRALAGDDELPEVVALEDFYAYMPMHAYIFAPPRQLWPASSINARLTTG